MNSTDLYQAICEVDDDILERSEAAPRGGARTKIQLKWAALAACLCLVIAGAAIWRPSAPARHDGPGITVSEDGVTIPPMDVTLSLSDGEEACMIPFFIYQGRCYVQYDRIRGDVDIIGEHLGTATGLIDVWTPKEGYVEFAGSVKGDFYAVRGYDPSFMLCMRETTGGIATYICNTGITLKYGSELYEDRLHLSDGIQAVQYESRFSWYYSKGELYQMDRVGEAVTEFIRDLDNAQFVPYDRVPLEEGQTSLADTELYHMYFQMKDGTTVHLRLHKNGYVRFDGMWDLCVQVPKESYDTLLALLDSHTDSMAVEKAGPTGPTLEDCRNDAGLGSYVPAYTPEDFKFAYADIYYYLDRQTGDETGTKELWISYASPEDANIYYSIIITWADEYGQNGWAGPMFDAAELSVESISEHTEHTVPGSSFFDVGIWLNDVSVVMMARNLDAETAYRILSSVQ